VDVRLCPVEPRAVTKLDAIEWDLGDDSKVRRRSGFLVGIGDGSQIESEVVLTPVAVEEDAVAVVIEPTFYARVSPF
jgi:hypothetical protein